jgi:Ni/Fe-hydrogenase subunit HybB-like protein
MSAPGASFDTPPVVLGNLSPAQVDEQIAAPMARIPGRRWWFALAVSGSLLAVGLALIGYTVAMGIGVWGNNTPVYWAFGITNFVFWIGIGHAGTLISAILFLCRQSWRNAIARFAEAMTLFAVVTAGLFPLIHTGRPWLAFWLFPYPNDMRLWINFRSPLAWDVFAVSTYGLVSLMFWYVGLIPDLAAMRERAATKVHRFIYTVMSFGWTGLNRHWRHYERAYLLLAGLSTPLVVSVHTIVSFDFATSIIPGWHSTIFPPYFVAGAVFSGFAMVLTVLVVLRQAFHMERLITMWHLENMNKVMLATGSMVGFAYLVEIFAAWYSGEPYERFVFLNRITGPYWWGFAIMFACNVIAPQVHWFKRARTSIPIMFVVSILVNVGMWFERFVIIVSSLHRDFLPSSWGMFRPSLVDLGILAGSFGLFFTLVLVFVRIAPVISMTELKAVLPGAQPAHHARPPLAGAVAGVDMASTFAESSSFAEPERALLEEIFGLTARRGRRDELPPVEDVDV